MGHQINFYATSIDVAELEKGITGIESALILRDHSKTSKPCVVPSLELRESAEPSLFFYFVRTCDLDAVVTEHVPEQEYWGVDVLRSPVIEFTRCYLDEDERILRRGRVYYVEGYYAPTGVWIEKSELFRNWAKSVFKVIRKNLRKQGLFYVGTAASNWLARTGGKFVD